MTETNALLAVADGLLAIADAIGHLDVTIFIMGALFFIFKDMGGNK